MSKIVSRSSHSCTITVTVNSDVIDFSKHKHKPFVLSQLEIPVAMPECRNVKKTKNQMDPDVKEEIVKTAVPRF